ncbi:hypothetical protein OG21DRAFT_1601789 [Imleria badia]|nr:hypothetical protein OG21DRAFT_1601789 [Imleria badia]
MLIGTAAGGKAHRVELAKDESWDMTPGSLSDTSTKPMLREKGVNNSVDGRSTTMRWEGGFLFGGDVEVKKWCKIKKKKKGGSVRIASTQKQRADRELGAREGRVPEVPLDVAECSARKRSTSSDQVLEFGTQELLAQQARWPHLLAWSARLWT